MILLGDGGTFGKWLDHEDEALMNAVSALMRETPESWLLPSHQVRTQRETGNLLREGGRPWSGAAGSLTADTPSCEQYVSAI